MPTHSLPFACFAPQIRPSSPLRRAITAAYRRSEADCVFALLEEASLSLADREAIEETARSLVAALRARPHGRGVKGLVHEYALSSNEGVALMCLAEALLRIPDNAT